MLRNDVFLSLSNAAIVNEFAVYICTIGYCETRRYCALINQRYAIYDRAEIDYTPSSPGSLARSLFNIEPVYCVSRPSVRRPMGFVVILALYTRRPKFISCRFAIARESVRLCSITARWRRERRKSPKES